MRQLWDIKAYRLLFFAGFLSELGTYISEVAILLRIFELVGQQKQFLGMTQAVFLVFMILGTLLGGVWGERNSKHKILLLCEAARIPVLGAMLVWDTSPWGANSWQRRCGIFFRYVQSHSPSVDEPDPAQLPYRQR